MGTNERSKDKILKELEEEITTLFEKTLDYAQVACPTKDTYAVLRSKILRVGNDCIRNIRKRLQHYEVEFIANTEEIIEVKRPKIIRKSRVTEGL